MKRTSSAPLQVTLRWADGDVVPVGRLAMHERRVLFEYDPTFLATGLEISPFRLRRRPGVHQDRDVVFESGLPGVFNDSLPDGWGRLLLDRRVRELGHAPADLTVLDRLACVGRHGMGALCYEPVLDLGGADGPVNLDRLADESRQVLEGTAETVLPELVRLGGSPAGARPKVLVAMRADGTLVHGLDDMRPGERMLLVKFAATEDPPDVGAVEHAYAAMAGAAGIDVPETLLLPAAHGPGHFATTRFDRVPGGRLHVHTLSGLLHADHRLPSLDYEHLLRATLHLTRDQRCVAEVFRRAAFNVLAHNRDDHAKQFTFLMARDGTWRVSPAYDLLFSDGPAGEHSTTVAGEARRPGRAHLIALAATAGLRPRDAEAALSEVAAAVARWPELAARSGVGRASRDLVAEGLARVAAA